MARKPRMREKEQERTTHWALETEEMGQPGGGLRSSSVTPNEENKGKGWRGGDALRHVWVEREKQTQNSKVEPNDLNFKRRKTRAVGSEPRKKQKEKKRGTKPEGRKTSGGGGVEVDREQIVGGVERDDINVRYRGTARQGGKEEDTKFGRTEFGRRKKKKKKRSVFTRKRGRRQRHQT